MTTSTTPISLAGTASPVSVAQELSLSLTGAITLNDANVRSLSGLTGGTGTAISLNDLRTKSSYVTKNIVISANALSPIYNFNSLTVPGYIAGKTIINLTINAGVYIWSNYEGQVAMIITGGAVGDILNIINNGYIMGQGGNGGNASVQLPRAGTAAISLQGSITNINIINNGYIGGGGGGGAYSNLPGTYTAGGGGGAGGGNGGGGWTVTYYTYAPRNQAGPPGAATPGTAARDCDVAVEEYITGAGGGRIMPGLGGAGANLPQYDFNLYSVAKGGGAGGGGGGDGQAYYISNNYGGSGGSGGAPGNAGSNNGQQVAGGGGGWGASGGPSSGPAGSVVSPGAGGAAILLNGRTVTRSGAGVTWGSVA